MPEIPDGARVPEDHRPAAADPTIPPTVLVDIRGVKVSIDTALLDDFELMTDVGRVEDGDASRMGQILRQLVAADTLPDLLDAYRNPETGKVSLESGTELFMDLFGAIKREAELPNS